LLVNAAAFVAGVSTDTLRRRAGSASEAGKPIGILLAGGLWLFSERRLLASIETKEGLPARLEAEARARKNADLR
jgi:hypothetical protein